MQGLGSLLVSLGRTGLWTLLVLHPLWLVLSAIPPQGIAEAQESSQASVDPLYFARWNINYGEYLIDVGKYLEALEAFQTAIEATTNPQIQAEARLQRASTLAIFLDDIDAAAGEYQSILQLGGQHSLADTARFRLGMLFFDQQRHPEAIEQFEQYLRLHPQGRFARSAEVLLAQSRRAAAKTPTAPSTPPPVRRPIPTAKPPTTPTTPPPVRRPIPSERTKPKDLSPPSPRPSLQRLAVRVRLIKRTKRVEIRGTDTLKVTTVGGQSVLQGQKQVVLRPGRGSIMVGQRSTQVRELRLSAVTPVSLVSRTIRCYRRDKKAPGVYRGTLRVFLHEGQLRVVNEIDIEEYLYGVVPAEVPSSWPPESLKALAIAARTYAVYQAKHRSDWTYDLVDSDGDQVYRGKRCETKRTNRAVDATRGTLLTHAQRPILAMYTSNTGWHSATAQHIFGTKLPYLIGVEDPYSPSQPMGHWKRTHDVQEVEQKLGKIGLRYGTIKEILPQSVTPSGRITHIKLVSSRGTKVLRARSTIRRALDLPEVLLNITRQRQTYVFEGGGFGHGVGLSQWGAKGMASKGKSAEEILHFYYRNVRVERLW